MARGLTGILGLALMGLSIVFVLFIILSAVTPDQPLDRTYFLEADTSGIQGARDTTRWTFLHFCGEGNKECSPERPAPAFGRAWAPGATNAPPALSGRHGGDTTARYYYFMWRFGWVWFILALASSAVAFFSGFLACCGRVGAFISSVMSLIALGFWTLAAVFMTVVFVKARDEFQSENRRAKLGPYAFGFAWGGWASVFLATLLFCLNMRKTKRERHAAHPPRFRGGTADAGGRRFPFFGRKAPKGDFA